VGQYAGSVNASIRCENCWSEGSISGLGAGGIFGMYAGAYNGYALAIKCYSIGAITLYAGAIFGAFAAQTNGEAIAQKCYSRGAIGTDGGGIFGASAADSGGATTVTNCYSSGAITTSGNGIYGSTPAAGASVPVNCYAADGSWSNTTANAALEGVPSPDVGTTWVARGIDQPYELNGMGYTPYTVQVITATPSLNQNHTQTISPGDTSDQAVTGDASGNDFEMLLIEGGDSGSYSTISINGDTGAITTTAETVSGTYTLYIRSIGSYNITTFELTVTEAEAQATQTCCQKTMDIKGLDYETRTPFVEGNAILSILTTRRAPISYTDLYKIKMAQASKR
jgi:hypothetical protein